MRLARIAKARILFWLVLPFILPIFVVSQPFVTQVSEPANSFSISVPSEQTHKKDSEIKLVASVFNVSGLLLGANNGVGCRAQVLDADNNLVLNQEMGFSDNRFNVTIKTPITGKQKTHPYQIVCNTSTQGGFRTGEISISESGLPKNIENIALIFSALGAILLFVLALTFKDTNLAFASGFLFSVIGIYFFRFGYLGLQNFISDSLALVTIGIGISILFRTVVEHLEEAES